jgi:hypothetical protein
MLWAGSGCSACNDVHENTIAIKPVCFEPDFYSLFLNDTKTKLSAEAEEGGAKVGY